MDCIFRLLHYCIFFFLLWVLRSISFVFCRLYLLFVADFLWEPSNDCSPVSPGGTGAGFPEAFDRPRIERFSFYQPSEGHPIGILLLKFHFTWLYGSVNNLTTSSCFQIYTFLKGLFYVDIFPFIFWFDVIFCYLFFKLIMVQFYLYLRTLWFLSAIQMFIRAKKSENDWGS